MAATCTYKGQTYSEGSEVCQEGNLFRCDMDGTWRFTGRTCSDAKDGQLVTPPTSGGPPQNNVKTK